MPRLAQLRAYDNSVDVAVGTAVPEPRLVLGMDQGRLTFPITPDDIRATPDWAKALVAPPDKSPDAARPDESEKRTNFL